MQKIENTWFMKTEKEQEEKNAELKKMGFQVSLWDLTETRQGGYAVQFRDPKPRGTKWPPIAKHDV